MTREDTQDRGKLVQAIISGVSILSSSTLELMGTYKCQPIGTWIRLDVLDDVPVWHPRAHDTEWKQCLRNLDDGEYVWVEDGLGPINSTTKGLV
jgi:hypothetical protein